MKMSNKDMLESTDGKPEFKIGEKVEVKIAFKDEEDDEDEEKWVNGIIKSVNNLGVVVMIKLEDEIGNLNQFRVQVRSCQYNKHLRHKIFTLYNNLITFNDYFNMLKLTNKITLRSILLTYGYIRNCIQNMKIHIPKGIITNFVIYLDIFMV